MNTSFTKYPIDLIVCMLISIILVPIALFNINGTLRIVLGLPFILFIPGYVLVFALFPQKKLTQGIDTIERIALSFGLSIAIVPLLGLLLNYTPWGIRLEPILFSIFIFNISAGFIGLYRWSALPLEQRFIIIVNLSLPTSESKLDKALTIILAIAIICTVIVLLYVIMIPKQGEQFTEFYVLGPGGVADEYPSTLALGGNATGYVGIANHEYRSINYTVEVWFLEQRTFFNESSLKNETVYLHMWFIDKIEVTLDYEPVDIEKGWEPQWQHFFSYPLNEPGLGKLMFLLYTNHTDEYIQGQDYVGIADEKISKAYRDLHLWIGITNTKFYLLDAQGMPEAPARNISVGKNITGIVGIVNNELRTVNYTVDIWLINQTTLFDEDLQQNVTSIDHMWYLDGIKIWLNYTEESLAWEQNYSVAINRTGTYKVMFLLFTTPTEGYLVGEDYKDRAALIFAAAQIQQSVWVNVT